MARADRLLRLLHTMRTMPTPVTAAGLAAVTEVSVRSIYHDIDALRAAGARIEGERGYGYRLTEDTALPPQTFDHDELEALALGLSEVRSMGDATLDAAARSALAKIAAILPDSREQQLMHAVSQVFRPRARYKPFDLTVLRRACRREEAIAIRYKDGDGTVSERIILPLALSYHEACVTILSWCCLREDFRMFRTDRLIEVTPDGTSFRPRRVVLLRDYLSRLRALSAD